MRRIVFLLCVFTAMPAMAQQCTGPGCQSGLPLVQWSDADDARFDAQRVVGILSAQPVRSVVRVAVAPVVPVTQRTVARVRRMASCRVRFVRRLFFR